MGTKWGNSGQTAGTYCLPPHCWRPFLLWVLPTSFSLALSREEQRLSRSRIFLSLYLFVHLWNGDKRSRRPKLESKLEEFFSLPSSYSMLILMMMIIIAENLTYTRQSCECLMCVILFNLHKNLYYHHHYYPCLQMKNWVTGRGSILGRV